MLSIEQTQELLKIIDKNQLTVIGTELGPEFLTDYDKQLLKTYGINPDDLYLPEYSSIQTSFHFGMLADALGAIEAGKITLPDLRQYVKEGRYIPVSERQKAAIESIKMQSFSSLKALNGKIFSDVNNILVDRTAQQEFLAKETISGLDKAKTVTQIAHAIAEKTGDWNRNFDRIIETASQNAMEQGKAAEIQRRNVDKDPLVYKIPKQGACKHCIRLYLTNGIGSQPILFRLSQLIANGDNIGKKTEDWKAVVGTVHPFCRCPLQEYREGFLWNTATQSFSIPDPQYKEQTALKRPLIKVRIGEKEYLL